MLLRLLSITVIEYDLLCHSCTAPVVYRLRHESRRGADFPQYRQIDQRARKCVTAKRTSEVPAEQPMLDVLTPLSDCRQESVERWNGDLGGFVDVLDRFPQRDFGLWVFMCPIHFSVSFSGSLPQRGLPRPTALFPATTPRATTPVHMQSS